MRLTGVDSFGVEVGVQFADLFPTFGVRFLKTVNAALALLGV